MTHILACYNKLFTKLLNPPLTTIRNPGLAPRAILLDAQMIVRASCKKLL